jgi:hypothetical protein
VSDVVYRSEVRIKRIKGPVCNSVSPGRAGAVHFRPARRRCPSITTFAEPALQRSIALSPLRQGDWRFPDEPLRP